MTFRILFKLKRGFGVLGFWGFGVLAGVSHVEYLGDRFGVNLDDLGGFVVGVAEGDAGG